MNLQNGLKPIPKDKNNRTQVSIYDPERGGYDFATLFWQRRQKVTKKPEIFYFSE